MMRLIMRRTLQVFQRMLNCAKYSSILITVEFAQENETKVMMSGKIYIALNHKATSSTLLLVNQG